MGQANIHATAVVLGGRGVLILGPSGAGKTSLALHLLDLFAARSTFACLVADDRVWVHASGGRLVACAPDAIAGLAEIRGFGPVGIGHEARAVIDLAVRLVEPAAPPRLVPDDAVETILGVPLPRLDLPCGETGGAARAVAAWAGRA